MAASPNVNVHVVFIIAQIPFGGAQVGKKSNPVMEFESARQ